MSMGFRIINVIFHYSSCIPPVFPMQKGNHCGCLHTILITSVLSWLSGSLSILITYLSRSFFYQPCWSSILSALELVIHLDNLLVWNLSCSISSTTFSCLHTERYFYLHLYYMRFSQKFKSENIIFATFNL